MKVSKHETTWLSVVPVQISGFSRVRFGMIEYDWMMGNDWSFVSII